MQVKEFLQSLHGNFNIIYFATKLKRQVFQYFYCVARATTGLFVNTVYDTIFQMSSKDHTCTMVKYPVMNKHSLRNRIKQNVSHLN